MANRRKVGICGICGKEVEEGVVNAIQFNDVWVCGTGCNMKMAWRRNKMSPSDWEELWAKQRQWEAKAQAKPQAQPEITSASNTKVDSLKVVAIKCAYHPEREAVEKCTDCGKEICGLCLTTTAFEIKSSNLSIQSINRNYCPTCIEKLIRKSVEVPSSLNNNPTMLVTETPDPETTAVAPKETQSEADIMQTRYIKKQRDLEELLSSLNRQIEIKQKELVVLDEELLLQSFGFYKPRYDLQSSEMYKAKLDQIRERQAELIKSGKATICPASWSVNNDRHEGQRMIKDYTKLTLRSFNNECDATILNIKFSNIESIEKKIRKAFEVLNNLTKRMSISITTDYLNLKLEELYLCYEYQVKKHEEKEEQKRIKEQMREEAKLLKEIEEMKLKIEKEEKHFSNAIEAIDERLQKAQTDAERDILAQEKTKLQQNLAEVEKNKQDIQYREQNARAGYVYVISNIGAFGENVYKIGVTRRLEPTERVDELGDSSVPFDFDIHAMIFSDDAFALETALHKAFDRRKLNMINTRREFFNVPLKEIELVVKTNFNKPVEFTHLAEAAEYRQSRKLRDELVSESVDTAPRLN
jgi:hypothetical protein